MKVYLYRCRQRGKTFQHYLEGSIRADQTERLRFFGATLEDGVELSRKRSDLGWFEYNGQFPDHLA